MSICYNTAAEVSKAMTNKLQRVLNSASVWLVVYRELDGGSWQRC